MRRLPAAVSAFLLCALRAPAQGGPPVPPDPLAAIRPTILEALDRLNLDPKELGFPKTRPDPFALAAAKRALDDPLALPQLVSGWRLRARRFAAAPGAQAAFAVAAGMAGLRPFPALSDEVRAARTAGEALRLLLADPQFDARAFDRPGPLGEGLAAFFKAAAEFRLALEVRWGSPVVGNERLRAAGWLPALWTEERPRLGAPLDGVPEPKDLRAVMLDALRLDWDNLGAHSLGALKLLDEAAAALARARAADLPPKITAPGIEGDLRLFVETPAGAIAVGGPGPTTYRRDLFLAVDLGGDDRYLGRAAAACAPLGRPVALVLDLGGDDLYLGRPERPLDQGAAVFGSAVLLDLGKGRDFYRAGDLAQGAAVCGLGLLLDDGGDNVLRARGLAQGAAGFGFGVLALGAGDDSVEAARFAQGFGGVRGFGVLLDQGGDDLYRAGGLYLHAPLFQDRYQSLSQGFGIGERYRDASGGLGFLWSGGRGNDRYLTDIYGQGAGYWMGVGALVDEGGNDVYTCGQYGQGAGIHLAAGMLWDLGGNDDYTLHHGVGQGGAHDLAVGVLLDQGGDDYYQGAGLTQGGAKANAVGFLFDLAGMDCYAGALVGGKAGMQGYGERARGFGSVGVLLDFAGVDVFAHRPKDAGEAWTRGQWGLCWDLPGKASAGPKPVRAKARAARPESPLPEASEETFARLYAQARLWQVGANVPIVARARATLVALGAPAGRWLIEHELDAAHTLDLRALRAVIPKIGKVLLPDLYAALKSDSPRRRWNAIDLLQRMGERACVPRLVALLERDPEASVKRKAALALGAFGAAEALPGLDALVRSDDLADRRTAAQALRGIPGKQALHRLAQLLADASFTVRDPARAALRARGREAVELAARELATARGKVLREWLRLLAAAGCPPEAEGPLRALLALDDPVARRQAENLLREIEKRRAPASQPLPYDRGSKKR